MKKLFTTALLAVATIGLLSQPAKAQLVYTPDDLFIGFQKTGVTTNFVINIGQASLYNNPGSPFTLSSGSIGADLTAVFGAGWATDAALFWGAVGTPGSASAGGDPASTLYASKAETVFGTQETPYARASLAAQGVPRGQIVNFTTSYNGQTANATNPQGLRQAQTVNNSWEEFNDGSGNSFGYFDGLEGSFANGAVGAALDLFRMAPGSGLGTYRGTFTIDGSGIVTFSNAPPVTVPEPSTYGMLAMGLCLLVWVVRRNRPSFLV